MTSPPDPRRPSREQPLGELRARGRELRRQRNGRFAPATGPAEPVPGVEPPPSAVPDPFGAEIDAALPDGPDGIDWGPAGPPALRGGTGPGGWAGTRRHSAPSASDPRAVGPGRAPDSGGDRRSRQLTGPDAADTMPGTLMPGPGGFVAAPGRGRPPAAARSGGRPGAKGNERRQSTGPGRLVRPYMVSGGRTSSDNLALEMEALIVTTSLGEASLRALARERRQITELCRDVLSVAEISAHLDVPFGVACVLVGDLAGEGMVQVHRPASPDARPDLALLERVLYGLRDL
jgi:hypothetical protein